MRKDARFITALVTVVLLLTNVVETGQVSVTYGETAFDNHVGSVRVLRQAAPASPYWNAIRHLTDLPYFKMTESFHYLYRSTETAEYDVVFRKPGSLVVTLRNNSTLHVDIITRKLRGLSKSAVQEIMASFIAPGPGAFEFPMRAARFSVFDGLRLKGIVFHRAKYVQGGSIMAVRISARGYPWECDPINGCGAYISAYLVAEQNKYQGNLILDRSRGLPLRFDSQVIRGGRTYPGQHIVFRYN